MNDEYDKDDLEDDDLDPKKLSKSGFHIEDELSAETEEDGAESEDEDEDDETEESEEEEY